MKNMNLFVGVIGMSVATVFGVMTTSLPLFVRNLPGPALFPWLSLGLLFLSSLSLCFQKTKKLVLEIPSSILFVMLGLVFYFTILVYLGFFISNLAAMFILLQFLDKKVWYKSLLIAIIIVSVVYSLFTFGFSVRFDWGLLF